MAEKKNMLDKSQNKSSQTRVECGRNKTQSISERICKLCKLDLVEDEIHFLCNCSAYNIERQTIFASVIANIPNFRLLHAKEKFI